MGSTHEKTCVLPFSIQKKKGETKMEWFERPYRELTYRTISEEDAYHIPLSEYPEETNAQEDET